MGNAKYDHKNNGRNIMEPYGGAQKIQYRKYSQRHRYRTEFLLQKRRVAAACKVAGPNNIV